MPHPVQGVNAPKKENPAADPKRQLIDEPAKSFLNRGALRDHLIRADFRSGGTIF
jgi:hypothetical protein